MLSRYLNNPSTHSEARTVLVRLPDPFEGIEPLSPSNSPLFLARDGGAGGVIPAFFLDSRPNSRGAPGSRDGSRPTSSIVRPGTSEFRPGTSGGRQSVVGGKMEVSFSANARGPKKPSRIGTPTMRGKTLSPPLLDLKKDGGKIARGKLVEKAVAGEEKEKTPALELKEKIASAAGSDSMRETGKLAARDRALLDWPEWQALLQHVSALEALAVRKQQQILQQQAAKQQQLEQQAALAANAQVQAIPGGSEEDKMSFNPGSAPAVSGSGECPGKGSNDAATSSVDTSRANVGPHPAESAKSSALQIVLRPLLEDNFWTNFLLSFAFANPKYQQVLFPFLARVRKLPMKLTVNTVSVDLQIERTRADLAGVRASLSRVAAQLGNDRTLLLDNRAGKEPAPPALAAANSADGLTPKPLRVQVILRTVIASNFPNSYRLSHARLAQEAELAQEMQRKLETLQRWKAQLWDMRQARAYQAQCARVELLAARGLLNHLLVKDSSQGAGFVGCHPHAHSLAHALDTWAHQAKQLVQLAARVEAFSGGSVQTRFVDTASATGALGSATSFPTDPSRPLSPGSPRLRGKLNLTLPFGGGWAGSGEDSDVGLTVLFLSQASDFLDQTLDNICRSLYRSM